MMSIKSTLRIFFFISFLIIQSTSIVIKCNQREEIFNETLKLSTCIPDAFISSTAGELIEFTKSETSKGLLITGSTSSYIPLNFSGFLPNLEYFVFIESNLIEITENAFKNLVNLVELNLHSNKITKISQNSFVDLKNLRKLTLDANDILEIDESSLKSLEKLREVYLDDNELENLPAKLFHDNVDLRVVHMEMNRIKKIPVSFFHGLTHLREIKIDHNEIEALPSRIFIDNQQLKVLTMSHNKLKLIGDGNFKVFEGLEIYNFLDNPCTEELLRVYDVDDLKNVAEENCKPECQQNYDWLYEEIKETTRRGKRSVEDLKMLKSEILKELKGGNQNLDFEKFNEDFKKNSDELMQKVKSLEIKIDENEKNSKNLIDETSKIFNDGIVNLEDKIKNITDDVNRVNNDINFINYRLNEKKDKIFNITRDLNMAKNYFTKEIEGLKNIPENIIMKPNDGFENETVDENIQPEIIDDKIGTTSAPEEVTETTTLTNDDGEIFKDGGPISGAV